MPAMCDEREKLIGYVYDECGPEERRRIEDHLEACGTCRAEIGGLRSVRQDLLSWDVPPHESVWRPFVPAQLTPWWRQVPAWAMAAAAGAMFLVGAAGGVATHALVPHERTPGTVVAAPPMQITPAGVTATDLSEAEQRILQNLRSELATRVQRVSTPMSAAPMMAPVSSRDQLFGQLSGLITASEDRQILLINAVNNDMTSIKKRTDSRLDRIEKSMEALLTQQGGR